jgi:hypothetical protein
MGRGVGRLLRDEAHRNGADEERGAQRCDPPQELEFRLHRLSSLRITILDQGRARNRSVGKPRPRTGRSLRNSSVLLIISKQ